MKRIYKDEYVKLYRRGRSTYIVDCDNGKYRIAPDGSMHMTAVKLPDFHDFVETILEIYDNELRKEASKIFFIKEMEKRNASIRKMV